MNLSKLDIIKLIEKNPLTRLNQTYQNKLVNKIKNNFNGNDQQMFVASFYCYLNYNTKNDFVIDLENVWKWIGFSRKDPAKRLLEKDFTLGIDYKIGLHPQVEEHLHGGSNKEQIMITINTFKKFCLKAATKKADEIHEYYIKLEELLQETINEESQELKLQLENKDKELKLQLENKNKEYNDKLEKQKIIERQNILLKEFSAIGSIVYIIKVKTFEDNQYIIKIGESRIGIESRFNEHKVNYEECILLDCFLVKQSKEFESFLHNHEKIKNNRITNLQNHENERELFLIGNELSYSMITNIINNNIKNFNDYNSNYLEQLKLENENLKLQLENNKINENNLSDINFHKLLLSKIESLEKSNTEILSQLISLKSKNTTNFNEPLVTLGPRLQCINPESLKLVKVYDSVSELMKENNLIRRPSLNKAISENTIYRGFRWQFVSRELDPTIINIESTKQIKTQNIGYIAKINKEKTKIINIYLDKKVASSLNGNLSHSALDLPVKNFTLFNGYYYKLYDFCDEKLKKDFENANGEIILYKNGIGQFDINNKLIKEFSCKSYCCKSLSISDRTLAKALDKNIPYNNYYYKYLDEKLKI